LVPNIQVQSSPGTMSENSCPFVEHRYALLEQTFVHFNGTSLTQRAMGSKERARSIGHLSLWHERVYNIQDWTREPHVPPSTTKWELAVSRNSSSSDLSTAAPDLSVPIVMRQEDGDSRSSNSNDSWRQCEHDGEVHMVHNSIASSEEVTLMVRNFPANINRQNLIDILNQTGFAGKYNAVYMPMNLRSGGCHSNRGHAFVNMKKAMWANDLVQQWHKQHHFGATLNISPAEVQGLEACMKLWGGNKTRRIRNPACRPAFFP